VSLAGHVILAFLSLAFIHRFIAERVIPIPHEKSKAVKGKLKKCIIVLKILPEREVLFESKFYKSHQGGTGSRVH